MSATAEPSGFSFGSGGSFMSALSGGAPRRTAAPKRRAAAAKKKTAAAKKRKAPASKKRKAPAKAAAKKRKTK